jgi:GAF domain-containing protein
MLNPPIPTNEAERLKALQRYEVLDTPREEAFDSLTELAIKRFGVPIAVVSMVDHDRQWFKSCQGLDVTQTDRRLAFCAHAILSEQPLVVNDAQQDGRFADNPLVTGEPHIRFYAGAPLTTPDGYNLGTLCIIDRKPRSFSAEESAYLARLASMVTARLELRLAAVQGQQVDEALAKQLNQTED